MLDPRELFECTLPAHDASDVIRVLASVEECDGESSSFMVSIAKSCVLVQGDGEVISLPCDPSSASLSLDGMVVVGWTSGKTLHAYYGGEAILSRTVDLPSSAWKSFLVKSRVASASLFEFVLLVVCVDGSVCRVRVQSAHDTIQHLAQVSQSHPTLTACDFHADGRLLVVAGGIRSNAKDMEHGSSLSIWNIHDESSELLHYSTVLAHDNTITDNGAKTDSTSSWWSLLSSAEQLYPGCIQDVVLSPDTRLVALRDSSGHVSIRTVDTCATIVPWTLVGEAPVRSICWFDPHQLVTVVASHAAPVVCTIQDDSLVATRAPVVDSSAPATTSHALVARSCTRFYHLVCRDEPKALWTVVEYENVPVHVVFLRHVASGRFSDALALAAQHSLDADIVHKAAWQQFVQRSPTLPPTQLEHDLDVVLTAHATNLCDKSWTLDTIKQCVLDTPAACHSVWSFGLSLDAADVGLQQLLDRLETFLQLVAADNSNELHDAAFDLTRAMADLADCFDVASFQHYLDVSWLDIAIELATAGRIAALTVLMARHGYHVLPHRLAVLSALPASIPPRAFQHLLPAIPSTGSNAADVPIPSYSLGSDGVSIVPAPLRVAPDVTPAVVASYNDALSSVGGIESRRKAVGDWFAARCFEMDSLFGLLEDACALLALAWRCIGGNSNNKRALSIESMHEGLAKLQREFDELHLFVYEFELTPTWTIQEWQHQEASGASPQAKIEIVRQNDATSDKLRTLLHRGYITEGDLCAYIISMDKTLLTNLMWASTIVAASSPIASNAPSSRYFRDMPTLVTVVLACCFGFVLDGPDGDAKHDESQDFIECAWSMFQTLPKQLPNPSLQDQADTLEHFMTGMEILASYGVYRSPKTLRAGASSGSLAADLVVHCCQVAATSTGPLNVEKVLDDMLQLQEHAFPMALSTDATHALVMKTLLSAATDASPQLRQLCPDPLLLVDAAKAHFKNAASSTSPEVSLALTYFAWAASDSTNDGIDDYSDYTAILDATQWLEQCQGHPIPPASILLRSPTDRLAFVQELLLQRPHECLQHVAQLSKVAKWLDLTEHELQLWIWAAYAHLQTGHVAEAIQLTISMLGKLNHRHDKDAYVAQVTSLALDLAALSGGHYEARRDLCRAALVVVSDASSFLALLESAKQLDAVVQAMTVLQLTDADVALEKSDVKIPIADWLYDQLTVHQEVVHMQPRLLQKSLKATMQLLLAFSTSLDHSSHIVDALCKDGADQRDQNLIAARPFPRVVGQLAASLLQTGDVDMAVSHLETLPVSQAYEIWVAACAGLEADPTAQTELAQVAHDFFTFGNHVDLAGHFASLQVSSKQAADLDALEALHPSVDRSRFEVDVVYRYAALVTVLHEDDSHRSMVFALCDQYRMHRWELCVEFLESLLVDADRVATRDVELKKAQLPVDENGQTLLELTLSQPDALSQRLLHSTWNRVNPYDSIAWEYLWRLCLACQKRSPHLDESIPVDRLKLFVACAKKLRESGVSIDLAHFCGPVTSPPDVALAVQAAIPVVSGSSIKMLAMLLSKLHGVPASALIMIYIDMLWTHETCPEKAYDAARPFLAGLTTDHVVMLVQHFVGLPVVASLPLEPLYGYTFQSRRSFPLRLTPPKRQVIVCDLYNLVRGRPGTGRSEGVAVLETHVLWSTLLAFVDAANVPLSSTLVMSAMAPAKDASTPPFDQVIADTCSRGLSLRQVRTLLQLTSALDHDRDHLPLFQRHVADFLSAHVPTLHDVDHASTPNKVYEYLVMKWTSTAEPCAVSLPSPMKLRDLEPLETLFCSTVLSWLDGVELSSTTVLLLKWLHDIVPTTVCDAWNLPSASIVAMLYDLHGAINWKQHQSQVTTDFPAVFALALEAVADSPYTNEGLARLLIQWESTHVSSRAPASTSWPMQLRRALIETIELDEDVVPSAAPETTLAGGRDLWDSLWKRRHWCEPALDALLRNTPSAYASLTEAAAFRFLTTFGFTAVALLSPFERVHKAALRQLDWANLTGSHVELVLVRFSLQELQMWPQVPWERFVLHCHRVDRLAAQRSASDALVHHALTSALHLVVGFVVEEDFAMASRILCQAGHIHPMLWNTNLYEPLLRQFLAGWKRPKTLDGPRQALVDKLAYLIE